MFKPRFLVFFALEGPKTPEKREAGEKPLSFSNKPKKLAEQKENAERKALGRLYANIHQKLEDAREHIKNFKLDKVNEPTREFRKIQGVKDCINVLRDYMGGFMEHATPKEKELLAKMKPSFQLVLGKFHVYTVAFSGAGFSVIVDQQNEMVEADVSGPAPIKDAPDKPVGRLKTMIESRMESAYNQFKTEVLEKGKLKQWRTDQSGVLRNMINDYLSATYKSFTPTERASLANVSIQKSFPEVDDSPTFRIFFAANNYHLSIT